MSAGPARVVRGAGAIAVVGVVAFGGVAHAGVGSIERPGAASLAPAASSGEQSGQVTATITGNPYTNNISGGPALPVPIPTLPVPVPTALPAPVPSAPVTPPKGATPAEHVYITTTGAQPVSYAVAQFTVPAGLVADSLILSFADDATLGEDTSADTASLAVCPLTAPLNAASPDDPATYDCGSVITPKRTATSSGGTWTADMTALGSRLGPDGVFGVAILPLATDATGNSSVAVPRDSIKAKYHGTISAETPVTLPGPATPTIPAAPIADAPVIPQTLPPMAETPGAPSVPGPVTAPANQPALANQASTTPVDSTRRPLLLLLVPAVPILVLGWYRRTREAKEETEEDLLGRYPGLAQLIH